MTQAAPEALAALRRERLDPEILATLESRAGASPDAEVSFAEMRAAHERETPFLSGTGPAMAEERRLEITGPGGQPLIVGTFRPPAPAPAGTGPLPLVVFLHGGGWVSGSVATSAPVCRALAAAAGVVVASIEYRLAPEHPFPAGLEDALAATT